jgi:hypothetical protein
VRTVVRFFVYTPLYIESAWVSGSLELLLGKDYSPLIKRGKWWLNLLFTVDFGEDV